jgi:hypothetical protein
MNNATKSTKNQTVLYYGNKGLMSRLGNVNFVIKLSVLQKTIKIKNSFKKPGTGAWRNCGSECEQSRCH